MRTFAIIALALSVGASLAVSADRSAGEKSATVFVKGGCFERGDLFQVGQGDEKPVHEVCLDDFYIGRYEVTQWQWEEVMGSNPSFFKRSDNYPVEMVSWVDVQKFIETLRSKTGKKYRLPTEAEWEYAARSGGKKEQWPGASDESVMGEYAWHLENAGSATQPVGEKRPNGLGLYDMSGNVWEWVADRYDKRYYLERVRENPLGPAEGEYRVIRGGSWRDRTNRMRTSERRRANPLYRSSSAGFRLALSP